MFCDISKAFDRVLHRGLLCKLKAAGVTGNALKWFRSYLSNRKQRVVLPGVLSDWQDIKAGVPHGSILIIFSIHKRYSLFVCLFVLRLNVPVNNFSVMSGRSHRFLGN